MQLLKSGRRDNRRDDNQPDDTLPGAFDSDCQRKRYSVVTIAHHVVVLSVVRPRAVGSNVVAPEE
jgi:hypothetical protein